VTWCFHSLIQEKYSLVWCDSVMIARLLPVFWRDFLLPSSGCSKKNILRKNSIGFITYKRNSTPKQGNLSRLPENGCKNLSRNTRNNFPFNTLVTSQTVAILKGICPNTENLLKTGTNIIFSGLLTGVLLPP